MRSPWTPLRIALGALAAFAAGFLAFGFAGWGPPAPYEQAVGEVSRWCERVSAGILREPINTLGNLGFVAAGLGIFVTLARDTARGVPRPNRFVGNTHVAILYASAAVFLGPGSMAMHASHTVVGAWLDNVSMVAYILVPWLYDLSRMGRWSDRRLFGVYGTVLALYAVGYLAVGPELGIGLDLFGVSIALWIVSEVLYRWHSPAMRVLSGFVGFAVAFVFGITPAAMVSAPGEHWWVVLFWLPGLVASHPPEGRRRYVPWFWVGIVAFGSAYAIWTTGTADHPWCDPDSLVQAHAVWHLLCAVATVAFFLYFRTERPRVSGRDRAAGFVAGSR